MTIFAELEISDIIDDGIICNIPKLRINRLSVAKWYKCSAKNQMASRSNPLTGYWRCQL